MHLIGFFASPLPYIVLVAMYMSGFVYVGLKGAPGCRTEEVAPTSGKARHLSHAGITFEREDSHATHPDVVLPFADAERIFLSGLSDGPDGSSDGPAASLDGPAMPCAATAANGWHPSLLSGSFLRWQSGSATRSILLDYAHPIRPPPVT